jgi:hypothetical protein
MPQEKPKKKKPLSNTPAGLGAKLGSAVRESFPLAASPAALGASLGAKVKGYMDGKKKKPIERNENSHAPKGFYWVNGGLSRKPSKEKSDKG